MIFTFFTIYQTVSYFHKMSSVKHISIHDSHYTWFTNFTSTHDQFFITCRAQCNQKFNDSTR